MRMPASVLLAFLAGACSGGEEAANGVLPPGPITNASEVAAEALPAPLRALAERTVPGIAIDAAERKEREGRVYYDIEGRRPDGGEVELDVLQQGDAFSVVEVQRDIGWAEAPEAARTAAAARPDAFAPERVIESVQADGSVIYELFAAGRKDEPAMEVRIAGGKAEVLAERSAH